MYSLSETLQTQEVKPAFGVSEDELDICFPNGVINYGPEMEKLLHDVKILFKQVRNSENTPLVSVLLEGISSIPRLFFFFFFFFFSFRCSCSINIVEWDIACMCVCGCVCVCVCVLYI